MEKLLDFFTKWEDVTHTKETCQFLIDFIETNAWEFTENIPKPEETGRGSEQEYCKIYLGAMIYRFENVFMLVDKNLPVYKLMQDIKNEMEDILKAFEDGNQ